MKVIILAGGFGTRLSDYTETIPKPMVHIGERPIIWHIMKTYSFFGYKNFGLASILDFEVLTHFHLQIPKTSY